MEGSRLGGAEKEEEEVLEQDGLLGQNVAVGIMVRTGRGIRRVVPDW